MLFDCGSPPTAMFYVTRGLIRLSATAETGREAVLGLMEPGYWFGETSLFVNAPRSYDARAVVDSEVLVVPAAHFHAVVDDDPVFLRELLRLICGRYRLALQQINRTILQPFPVRLARRLLWEHARRDSGSNTPSPQAMRLSQQDLGHMLGVSRQSVNKQLKLWERQGLVRLDYGCVTVQDSEGLALRATPGGIEEAQT